MKSPGLCLAEEAVSEKVFGINVEIFKLDSLCLLFLIGKEIQIHTTFPTPSKKNPNTTIACCKYNDALHEVWAYKDFGF